MGCSCRTYRLNSKLVDLIRAGLATAKPSAWSPAAR
jgi:hypothetical protein